MANHSLDCVSHYLVIHGLMEESCAVEEVVRTNCGSKIGG